MEVAESDVTGAVGEVVLPAASRPARRTDALKGMAVTSDPFTVGPHRWNNPSARGQCFGIDEQA